MGNVKLEGKFKGKYKWAGGLWDVDEKRMGRETRRKGRQKVRNEVGNEVGNEEGKGSGK